MSASVNIPGEPLVELTKRGVAMILHGMASVFVIAGIGGAVIGMYWTLALIPVSPLMFWVAHSLSSQRLVVGSEGVYHVNGRGFAQPPQLVASARWQNIDTVELETKHKTSSNGSSTSYTLVFSPGEEKPLRYLIGIPNRKKLAALARVCKQRDVVTVL